MTDILAEICDVKREHVRAQKQRTSTAELEAMCASQSAPRGFAQALARRVADGGTGLIAEIKKASPSRGVIRADFHPATLAQAYQAGGATCVSVLTDTPYFQGADDYLAQARNAVTLPVLRKDFMVDVYQITESRALGADAILIIMAALSDSLAREMEDAAHELGMDALIEVHDEQELERALTHLRSPLIGINNRSLKTLKVDLATSERLRAMIPVDKTVVCESGIATSADVARMRAHNMHCFLVGESLMLQDDVTAATKLLLTPAE